VTGRRKRVPGLRKRYGRARTLWSTLGVTALGTVLPGTGIWLTGRHRLGGAILLATLVLAGLLTFGVIQQSALLSAAVDPDKLLVAGVLSFAVLLGLVTVAVLTYRMVRRPRAPDRERLIETAFVVVLCLLVATPFALGARYAFVQRDLVNSVFTEGHTVVVEDEDAVWGSDERVNVLLLGGDGGVHRIGIRTDTVILASLDAETGDTTLFSLPRNLQNVPFPPNSPLAELYPRGFTGAGDPLAWMLNAVYGKVPELHPDLLDHSENEGAEALKQAVSAALGIPVDYYVLVNLRGFQQLVDAIGGVTLNVNQPIPIGGNTDRGVPPRDYLDPGPSQHLDGFETMWFARGRYGLDDYDRMERQRCVMDAFIEEVDPLTLLRRYEGLASAGKDIVRTDIPQDLLPDFVELGVQLRDGDVRSVVFRPTNKFDPNNPDYAWMRRKVEQTLADEPADSATPAERRPGKPRRSTAGVESPQASPTADDGQSATDGAGSDPCAYQPVG
jgi:polyisoprenyl-teichoic acid--peptidoglycan teichoic acid transferase